MPYLSVLQSSSIAQIPTDPQAIRSAVWLRVASSKQPDSETGTVGSKAFGASRMRRWIAISLRRPRSSPRPMVSPFCHTLHGP